MANWEQDFIANQKKEIVMNHKKYFIFVILLVLLGLAACDPPAPGREPVDNGDLTPSNSGSERSVAQDPNVNYMEMHHDDRVDMDFNGMDVPELWFSAFTKDNGQTGYQFGEYVGQGSGIGLAPVTSIPDYATCKAIQSWHPGHSFELDDIFCFETFEGSYGYIHIVKLKEEQVNGVTTWTVGLNYFVWGP